MCEYFMICNCYNDTCSCDSCIQYKNLDTYVKDKFKELLKELKTSNLLEYTPIQAAIIFTRRKLDKGIDIINFDIEKSELDPACFWFNVYIDFSDNTTLKSYFDTYDNSSGISEIIEHDMNNILVGGNKR